MRFVSTPTEHRHFSNQENNILIISAFYPFYSKFVFMVAVNLITTLSFFCF